MALVARTASVGASSLASARLAVGVRPAGEADRSTVEALNPGTAVLANSAGFHFGEYGHNSLDGGRQERRTPLHQPGLMNASSESFAAIFESRDVLGEDDDEDAGARGFGHSGSHARATGIYETNVRVITGTNNPRGHHLSFSL